MDAPPVKAEGNFIEISVRNLRRRINKIVRNKSVVSDTISGELLKIVGEAIIPMDLVAI